MPQLQVHGNADRIVNQINLKFADGSTRTHGGRFDAGTPGFYFPAPPGHLLSSVKVMGVSNRDNSIDRVVFGWRMGSSYKQAS